MRAKRAPRSLRSLGAGSVIERGSPRSFGSRKVRARSEDDHCADENQGNLSQL